MNKDILIGILYVTVGQIGVWVQNNSQFIWPETIKYRLPIAIIGGSILSYIFMVGISYIVKGYDGLIWPSRIIPGALGLILFSLLTWFFANEGINTKTGVCIFLSILILLIQFYAK
jgi:hypothetical protein